MASRIAEAYVQIVPRIDGIGSSLTKGLSGEMGKAGEQSASSFSSGFKKFAGPAIAAGIAVAGTALIRFGADAIKAAEDARQASARVDQIAESMNLFGNESKVVSARIQAYAESQERLVAVDADVIKATQAKLLTFKEIATSADEAGGAFDRATMAAVDLAAAGFGSAESNAVQLGKALNDPIKGISALTRSGITFTASEKEKIKTLVESGNILEAQNMILGAIETQVGGTAAATATSSEKMRLGFEAVKDAVGAALLPAFDGIANFASSTVFPTIISAIEKLPALFTAAGEALAPFVDGFKTTFTEAGGGLQGFIAGLMDLRQKLFDAFLKALPGIIEAVVAFIPTLVQNSVMMITSLITAITSSLPLIIEGAILLFNGIITALTQVLPTIISALVEALPVIIDAIVKALPLIIQAAITLILGVIDGLLKALPQIISALVKAIPQIIKALTDALPQIIKGAIQLFLGIIKGLTEALPQIIQAVIDAIPQIVQAIIDAVPLFIDAGLQLIKGLVKGIIDNAPTLVRNAIRGVADLATNTFKNLLGIKSPSVVFYRFGENIVSGLVDGIEYLSGDYENAMKQLAERGLAAFIRINPETGTLYNQSELVNLFNAGWGRGTELQQAQGAALRQVAGNYSTEEVLGSLTGNFTVQRGSESVTFGTGWENSPEAIASIQELLAEGYKARRKVNIPGLQLEELLAGAISSAKPNRRRARMARGGYVGGPTNALIGEYGPEVVVPLNRFEKWMGLGEGNGKVINYYAAENKSIDSEQALIQAIKRAKVITAW